MPADPTPNAAPARISAVSWPAILAALAVAVALQLMLTLGGVAIGFYAVETREGTESVALAAAAWAAASMLVCAVVAGYVAGRGSGLRRRADGALHGLITWAATTLVYAALAGTTVGSLATGLFGVLNAGFADASAQAAVGTARDRERAIQVLTDIGLSPEQARSVMERMAGARGDAEAGAGREPAREAVGSVTLWLSGTVLLSLLLAMLAGMLGVRGSRRIVRQERTTTTARPRILSRT